MIEAREKENNDRRRREKKGTIANVDEHECLKWIETYVITARSLNTYAIVRAIDIAEDFHNVVGKGRSASKGWKFSVVHLDPRRDRNSNRSLSYLHNSNLNPPAEQLNRIALLSSRYIIILYCTYIKGVMGNAIKFYTQAFCREERAQKTVPPCSRAAACRLSAASIL